MKTTKQAVALSSLKDVIVKGKALREVAEQNRKDILAAVLELKPQGLQAQWDFVGQVLMPAMLPLYPDAEVRQARTGAYFFGTKGDDTNKRHSGAQSFMRQRLSLTTLVQGSGTTNTSKRSDPAKVFESAVRAAHEAGLSRSKLLAIIEMAL
jgi:hypothetical protein